MLPIFQTYYLFKVRGVGNMKSNIEILEKYLKPVFFFLKAGLFWRENKVYARMDVGYG